MPRPILVTGGAGYVGSHVTERLVAAGHDVVVLDNLETGHRQAVPRGAALIVADLRDLAALGPVFAAHDFAAIMHFAGYIAVGESMTDPMKYIGDNLAGAVNLLKCAARRGVGRFVLSSTAALFASQDRPIAEDAPLAPASPYGDSKLMIERLLHWAERAHGVRSACLRYFNAAGAHPDGHIGEDHRPETHLIPLAIRAALGEGPPLRVFGDDYPTPDGTCIRDYVHVLDLAEAHILALGALERGSVRYNLGTGRGHSVREVIDAVADVAGTAVPFTTAPRRPGDPPALVADPTAVKRDLGWSPRYTDLRAIVETAWRWHQAHPQGFDD